MIKFFFFLLLIVLSANSYGQADTLKVDASSLRLASRMKDSIGLTNTAELRILGINETLFREKQEVWKKNTSIDSITLAIQRIENKRDALYKEVLEPAEYLLYLRKKRQILNAQ